MVILQKTSLIHLNFIVVVLLFILIGGFFGYSQSPSLTENQNFYKSPIIICWKNTFNQKSNIDIASDNDNNLFLSNFDDRLTSISSIDGKKNWETDLGGEIISTPVTNSENIYLFISLDKVPFKQENGLKKTLLLRSLSKTTGLTNWEQNFEVISPENDKIYLYSYRDFLISFTDYGDIQLINRTNGQIVWKKSLKLKLLTIPFVDQDKIFVGLSDNRIIIFSLTSRNIVGEITIAQQAETILYDSVQNNLFWGDVKGNVFSFNLTLKKMNWQTRKGAKISNIVLTAHGLLITSLDNFIYLISYKNGDLVWKKRLDGRISAKPLVDVDFAIVTAIAEPAAIIIDLKNGKTINNIILEPDNFFTNEYIKYGDTLIYSTQKGIYAFSSQGACQSRGLQN